MIIDPNQDYNDEDFYSVELDPKPVCLLIQKLLKEEKGLEHIPALIDLLCAPLLIRDMAGLNEEDLN